MTMDRPGKRWRAGLLLAMTMTTAVALQGCDRTPAAAPQAQAAPAAAYAPITVTHKLGATVITQAPRRVVALDMNEADFLDQLGVTPAGMPKDYVPRALAKYGDDPAVADVGAIVSPNLERVHAARPDLILITSLQATHYAELSRIAPTIHFDVDYGNSQSGHLNVVKDHLLTLGRLFGKEETARAKAAELDAKALAARRLIEGRPEKALILLHNNGAFSAFGPRSRYGFVFDALGVKSASGAADTGLHGQPVSSEFIQQADPDILYIVDRTAVMERRAALTAESIANPLLRQTKAWRDGRVVFADAEAWYITAASVGALETIIDDVLAGYRQ